MNQWNSRSQRRKSSNKKSMNNKKKNSAKIKVDKGHGCSRQDIHWSQEKKWFWNTMGGQV